jgi:hypothetical protein
MTRIAFTRMNPATLSTLAFLALASIPLQGFATVDSPVVQSLGGAGRAGLPREALFTNPASVALNTSTFGFMHYSLPKIPDYNAGGRAYNVGIYDAGNQTWKGGFSYSRSSKAVLTPAKTQGYEDRSEFRFVTGHAITGNIIGGLQTRYSKKHSGPESSRFVEFGLGVLFPLFADLRGGLTWENILGREDHLPSTIGLGATYSLGFGVNLFADGYRLMGGRREGERGWALGGEVAMAADFKGRVGLFEEGYRGFKGWSVGASWSGPRASFDWAMRTAASGPKEREHVLGMTLAL